ncbi:hypothetical protein GGQ88_004274 [Novosphingobium hassiacum]|uniref:Uncharacterized protein n=1 Tax=Novosphingobium hassiacum TaxID=173676 RepID=A0A7W6A4A7_9SPHN|nr:hypothetical protein [Novosphingobium hassiacum]
MSEPADARATYGISATTLVVAVLAWAIQSPSASGRGVQFSTKAAAIVVPIGNLSWLRLDTAAQWVGLRDTGQRASPRSSAPLPQRRWV